MRKCTFCGEKRPTIQKQFRMEVHYICKGCESEFHKWILNRMKPKQTEESEPLFEI